MGTYATLFVNPMAWRKMERPPLRRSVLLSTKGVDKGDVPQAGQVSPENKDWPGTASVLEASVTPETDLNVSSTIAPKPVEFDLLEDRLCAAVPESETLVRVEEEWTLSRQRLSICTVPRWISSVRWDPALQTAELFSTTR